MHSAPWRRSRTPANLAACRSWGPRSPTCLRKIAADKPAKIPQTVLRKRSVSPPSDARPDRDARARPPFPDLSCTPQHPSQSKNISDFSDAVL
eukprot:3630746-Prymnesium_polylepis.1